jgi:hypothetical protein
MSLAECDRFSADLQSNAVLRAEVEKIHSDKSQPALAGMVALAVSKGYSVTLAEAREYVKAKAAAAGQVLSDADLDGVAAGSSALAGLAGPPGPVSGAGYTPPPPFSNWSF